jgi:hypothetical protein
MRTAFALAAAIAIQAPATVRLEIRVFNGADEVTSATRVTVYKAGEHDTPVAVSARGAPLDAAVVPGLYDAQAIREKDARVLNIRWAERLVVMPYPDEGGRHLEVINFESDFGALQVKGAAPSQATLFSAGLRAGEAARPLPGNGYVLFVAPAGRYDLRTATGAGVSWHAGIDVPRDRTRFWIVP